MLFSLVITPACFIDILHICLRVHINKLLAAPKHHYRDAQVNIPCSTLDQYPGGLVERVKAVCLRVLFRIVAVIQAEFQA